MLAMPYMNISAKSYMLLNPISGLMVRHSVFKTYSLWALDHEQHKHRL